MSKQRASIPVDPPHSGGESGARLAAVHPDDWRVELDAIYREHDDPAWAMIVAAGVPDPEDAHQELFLELAEKMAKREAITSVRGLLGTILFRHIANKRRSLRRHPHADLDIGALSGRSPNPEQALAKGEEMQAFNDAFEALPDEVRKLVEEMELDGVSPVEIAARTGVPYDTLRKRGARGRGLLRELFLRFHGKDRGDRR